MTEHYVEVVCEDPVLGAFDPKTGKFELAKIMCWVCPGCDRVMDWEFGCAHDDPEEAAVCDDCWVGIYGDA
jgi:hypothetical protein